MSKINRKISLNNKEYQLEFSWYSLSYIEENAKINIMQSFSEKDLNATDVLHLMYAGLLNYENEISFKDLQKLKPRETMKIMQQAFLVLAYDMGSAEADTTDGEEEGKKTVNPPVSQELSS